MKLKFRENKFVPVIIFLLALILVGVIIKVVVTNSSSGDLSAKNSNISSSSSLDFNDSSSSFDDANNELVAGSSPTEDAACVIYYAMKNNMADVEDSSKYYVKLSTDEDILDSLSKEGQGMVYEVYPSSRDINPMFLYTINKDDVVNIYNLPSDFSQDDVYEPVKSVSKVEIVNYLNSHSYGNAVNKMASKVVLKQ